MKNYFYKNLYEILGLEPTGDQAAIKSAYRAMARKYHPDLNPGSEVFVVKFKEITEAYEILSDKDKKGMYDAFKGYSMTRKARPQGTNARSKEAASSRAGEADKAYKQAQRQKTASTAQSAQKTAKNASQHSDDPKASFSDVFNDILEGLFHEKNKSAGAETSAQKPKEPRRQPKNGTDVISEVTISYVEAISGTHRTVNILHTDVCPNCLGKMFINGAQCPLCHGTGETSIHKKINVKIPKNIKQGAKIRIANEGNRGQHGGRNGDVYLIVKIENDSKYIFEGLNASMEVSILPHEAVFGADISVDTPQGTVMMKIPANTSAGQKFRLSSHGLRDGENVGDVIVTAKIDLPKSLTEEELALYKKLAELSKDKVIER